MWSKRSSPERLAELSAGGLVAGIGEPGACSTQRSVVTEPMPTGEAVTMAAERVEEAAVPAPTFESIEEPIA